VRWAVLRTRRRDGVRSTCRHITSTYQRIFRSADSAVGRKCFYFFIFRGYGVDGVAGIWDEMKSNIHKKIKRGTGYAGFSVACASFAEPLRWGKTCTNGRGGGDEGDEGGCMQWVYRITSESVIPVLLTYV
jgi:hypothetical protein